MRQIASDRGFDAIWHISEGHMTEPNWDDYPNFSRHEFVCKCGCDRADMQPSFMQRLQNLRNVYDGPLAISSGFRCPEYNQQVSSTGPDGPHTKGRAADIAIFGDDAYDLSPLIHLCDFTGIGWQQTGSHQKRFVHVDDLMPPEHSPRPWIWTY